MEHNFAVSTESGQVFGFDSRKIKEPVFTVQAHEQSCSQVCFSPHIPNLMVTSGTEGIVKIWDIAGKGGDS
jgi:periodic tryptophan protein 1